MWWIPIITAVVSLVAGYQQMQSQKKLASQQEALGREAQSIAEQNAQRIEAENLEATRRAERQTSVEEAQARAFAGASGFAREDTGSIALTLSAQKEENARQLAYLKTSGASQAEIARHQGGYAAQTAGYQASASRSAGTAALLKGVAGSASAFSGYSGFGMTQPPAPVEERLINFPK